jgi:hypothetical protein
MLPPERRREIAEPLGISEQYLYQILRGDGVASPALARRLNAAEPSLALRDLRPDDWQDIWPELAESEAKKPPALDHQAPAAINSEAKEVAHA